MGRVAQVASGRDSVLGCPIFSGSQKWGLSASFGATAHPGESEIRKEPSLSWPVDLRCTISVQNPSRELAAFGKPLKLRVDLGMMAVILLVDPNHCHDLNVLEYWINDAIIPEVETSEGFERPGQRLRASDGVGMNLLFELALQRVSCALRKPPEIVQGLVGELGAIQLTSPQTPPQTNAACRTALSSPSSRPRARFERKAFGRS